MVKGRCEECGKGRIPLFTVNHGKVTRLPGMPPQCQSISQLTARASQAVVVVKAS